MGYGHGSAKTEFTEETWTNPEGSDVTGYIKSKTLAERAAWDFIQQQGGKLELAVINPVGIFGPVLGDDVGSSIQIVQQMLAGRVPAAPNVRFGVVDVRDVADLHLLAMVDPKAKGERFIGAAGETMSMLDVATILRNRLGAAAAAAPTRTVPDLVVRLMGVVSPRMRSLAPQLGVVRSASNVKARERLGWTPRPNDDVIAATGEALLRLGLVSKR